MATTACRRPFYCDSRTTGEDIQVYDGGDAPVTSGVTVECFCTPRAAQWAYVVVNNKALYNPNVAVDFELHRSEADTLVNKILELAGIVMNDPTLAQLSAQNVATEDQLQKV